MSYKHWELLLYIYRQQKSIGKSYKFQCNQTLLKTCLKNGWVVEFEPGLISVTDKGFIAAANEIAPLYEHSNRPSLWHRMIFLCSS